MHIDFEEDNESDKPNYQMILYNAKQIQMIRICKWFK